MNSVRDRPERAFRAVDLQSSRTYVELPAVDRHRRNLQRDPDEVGVQDSEAHVHQVILLVVNNRNWRTSVVEHMTWYTCRRLLPSSIPHVDMIFLLSRKTFIHLHSVKLRARLKENGQTSWFTQQTEHMNVVCPEHFGLKCTLLSVNAIPADDFYHSPFHMLTWSSFFPERHSRFLHVVSKRKRLTRALTKHTSRVVLHLIRQTDWRLFLLVRRERVINFLPVEYYHLHVNHNESRAQFLLEWHLCEVYTIKVSRGLAYSCREYTKLLTLMSSRLVNDAASSDLFETPTLWGSVRYLMSDARDHAKFTSKNMGPRQTRSPLKACKTETANMNQDEMCISTPQDTFSQKDKLRMLQWNNGHVVDICVTVVSDTFKWTRSPILKIYRKIFSSDRIVIWRGRSVTDTLTHKKMVTEVIFAFIRTALHARSRPWLEEKGEYWHWLLLRVCSSRRT